MARPHLRGLGAAIFGETAETLPPASAGAVFIDQTGGRIVISWENDGNMMGISWYNNYIMGISWDRRKSGVSYCHQPHIFFSVLKLLKSNSTGVIAAASIPCPSSQTTFEILWGEARWRTGRASRCARQKIRGHKGAQQRSGICTPISGVYCHFLLEVAGAGQKLVSPHFDHTWDIAELTG